MACTCSIVQTSMHANTNKTQNIEAFQFKSQMKVYYLCTVMYPYISQSSYGPGNCHNFTSYGCFLTEFFLLNFYFLSLGPAALDVFKCELSFARIARRRKLGVGGQKVQKSPACRHFYKVHSISGF